MTGVSGRSFPVAGLGGPVFVSVGMNRRKVIQLLLLVFVLALVVGFGLGWFARGFELAEKSSDGALDDPGDDEDELA